MKTSIRKHVAAVFAISANFAIFASISQFAQTIATALVSCRLNYCNSLLYNTANKDIAKLQHVQNYLARVVMRSHNFSHSVPLLK